MFVCLVDRIGAHSRSRRMRAWLSNVGTVAKWTQNYAS